MRQNEIRKKRIAWLLFLGMTALLTGCDASDKEEEKNTEVTIAEYQKDTYQTVTVQCGTIQPVLTLKLVPDEYEINSYFIHQEMLEVEENNVEKGGKVEAGDVMVSFKADDIEEDIAVYEERRAEDEMLIEHYTKLMKINKEEDYSADLKKIKNDLSVANLYIKEQKDRLSGYRLVADKAGIVTFISEELYKGYATAGMAVVKVASGSTNYTASTVDDYVFHIGDIHKAKYEMAEYEMKVIAVEKKEGKNVITFEPVSDMTGVAETDELSMDIEKTAISNVTYVEQEAVITVEDKNYVYLLDDNGFRQVVPVTVGEVIDGYIIIKDGLKKGEQVTVN